MRLWILGGGYSMYHWVERCGSDTRNLTMFKKGNFPTLQTFRQNADFGSLLKKFNPKQSLKAIHRLAACPP